MQVDVSEKITYIINPDPEIYADLWINLVHELRYGDNPNKAMYIEQMKVLLATGKYHVVVAMDSGEPIGYSDVLLNDDPATNKLIGHGMHLYINPEYRDGLIASKIFKEIEEISYEEGAEILEIQCYPAQKRLWDRQGFKQTQFIMRRV